MLQYKTQGQPLRPPYRITFTAPRPVAQIAPTWRAGNAVRWQRRAGVFHRNVGDGEHAEIKLNDRLYRVRLKELA